MDACTGHAGPPALLCGGCPLLTWATEAWSSGLGSRDSTCNVAKTAEVSLWQDMLCIPWAVTSSEFCLRGSRTEGLSQSTLKCH